MTPGGGGYQGVTEHGITLGFGLDQAQVKQVADAFAMLNVKLNQFADSVVSKFAEAGLSMVGFEEILKKLQENVKKSVSGTGAGGGRGEGLTTATAQVQSFGSAATRWLGEASAAFAGLATAAAGAVGALAQGLGNTQIQMEMLSRTLWTSQQQALAFSSALKATGASLQGLYLSPTLMRQYQNLHALALQLEIPGGYSTQAQTVNNLSLAMKRFQLAAQFGLLNVGFYFAKYLAGPMASLNQTLLNLSNTIARNMPSWAAKIGAFLAVVAQAGVQIWQALSGVYGWLKKLAAYLPGWAKAVGAALLLVSVSNPFMLLVEGIGAAILVFNDFVTYLHGGKSEFAGLWRVVMRVADAIGTVFSAIRKSGVLAPLLKSVVSLGKALGALATAVGAAFGALFSQLGSRQGSAAVKSALGLLALSLEGIAQILTFVIQQTANFINWLAHAPEPIKALIDALAVVGATILAIAAVGNPITWVLAAGVLVEELATHWKSVTNAVSGFGNMITNVVNLAIMLVDNLIRVLDHIPGIHIPLAPLVGSIGGTAARAHAHGGEAAARAAVTHPSIYAPTAFLTGARLQALLGQNVAPHNVTVNAPLTTHVHGTSPAATADSVTRLHYSRTIRALRGPIG